MFAVAGCLVLFASSARAVTFDAHAWPTSVQQGDSVSIYISSSQPTIQVQIVRFGATVVPYATYSNVAAGIQAVPDSAFAKGCDWTPTLRLAIPDDWPSGVYAAKLIPSDTPRYAPFVVRQKHPGSTSRMLYVLSLTTMHAYNFWGGKSLYPFNSSGRVRSDFVSIRRPFGAEFGLSNFPDWGQKFIQFIESRGYTMEYCTGLDLHRSPDLPMRYGVVVSAGHDEYYSREMRRSLQAHVARGGSVLFFGGNTCWWQIRVEGDDRIVCYKLASKDPLTGTADSLVTVNWYDTPVSDPENSLTGLSFRNGGAANVDGFYLAANGYRGFVVYNTSHWAFAGTGMSQGDTLGRSEAIVGYETDGALYHMVGGSPVATGADGSPTNLVILGLAPGSNGMATMGVYESPGLVFNAGTTGWVFGLPSDSLVQRITLNVVDRALQATALVAAPGPESRPGVLGLRVLPNPARGPVAIQWCGAACSPHVELAIYDLQGALWARPMVTTTDDVARAVWNTRDRNGRPAPSGLYFVRVEGEGVHASSRFMLVR